MSEKNSNVRRGDIYYASLDPTVGSELGGTRPVLVLQNNLGNRHSPTLIVAAITSRTGKPRLPTHVPVTNSVRKLYKDSVILLEQVRSIDRSRLREYIGILEPPDIEAVDKALEVSVGLVDEYNY